LRAGIEEKESVPAFLVFGNKSEDIISLLLSSCKKMKKLVDKLFEGWYYSQRRRKQHRHNKNNSETIMRIVVITKTIQNY